MWFPSLKERNGRVRLNADMKIAEEVLKSVR
jgi:hypothetical protein